MSHQTRQGRPAPPQAPAVLVLRPEPAAVRLARAFVLTQCRTHGTADDLTDTAVLLTSEVVTNAFLHGRSQTRLAVTAHPQGIRVDVSDDNSRHPTLAPLDTGALDGRGMTLVDLLSTTWGVRDEALGKTVWFELGTQPHKRRLQATSPE